MICPKKGCGAVMDPIALIAHMKTHALEEAMDSVTEKWSEFDPGALDNMLDEFDLELFQE